MKQEQIGFSDFQKEVRRQMAPLLDSATIYLGIGSDMFCEPFSGQLATVVGQIARSIANSLESVLILVSNGCANDAIRIARTMFESAVTIQYLESHPELVQDYVDFRWVKRMRDHDDLLKYHPDHAERVDPQQLEKMSTEYKRVKLRFTGKKGKVRNSWCRANFRTMAEEVRADSMYWGLYDVPSSFIHTSVLGLGAFEEITSVPCLVNIPQALGMGVFNYAMTLSAVNHIAELTFGDRLDEAFSQFKQAFGAFVQ